MRLSRRVRHETVDKTRAKAAKRLDRLTVSEILDWSDQAGSEVARSLMDYRRYGERSDLANAAEGISALQGCLDVLLARDRV
jgi:adenylate cyclase